MKTLIVIVLTVILMLAAFIGWYHWDSSRNRGNEFGYYGEFNRVSNALTSIPGVAVAKAWHNADVTLEEFSFDITITGQPLRLYFGETDQIRKMSKGAAAAALKSRINTELSTTDK